MAAEIILAIRIPNTLRVQIDTAAVYGLGHSEEVVAKALAGIPAQRRSYVFTKCARVWDKHRQVGKCLNVDSIRRGCEATQCAAALITNPISLPVLRRPCGVGGNTSACHHSLFSEAWYT